MSRQLGRGVSDETGGLQRLGHDLRQPAAAISMLAAVVELHPDLPPDVRDGLDQIRVEARRISDVCGYLLGEVDGLEVADLPRIATQVVESARATSGVAIDLVTTPVVVRANCVDVSRALANLVENACRVAGPGGSVLVRVSASAEGARLEVHDSGPGWGEGPTGTAALGGHLESGTGELGGAVACLVLPSVMPDYLDVADGRAGRTPERAAG
jgi:signal transduction histidine kinase